MKPTYDTPEAEWSALRDAAAASWALTHRPEYDAMLAEAFPTSLMPIPGEFVRRMEVVVNTCASRSGRFPHSEKVA